MQVRGEMCQAEGTHPTEAGRGRFRVARTALWFQSFIELLLYASGQKRRVGGEKMGEMGRVAGTPPHPLTPA